MVERRRPGEVRDAIMAALQEAEGELTIKEIRARVETTLGRAVAPSSVRSYLNLNTPGLFERTSWGTYRLARK